MSFDEDDMVTIPCEVLGHSKDGCSTLHEMWDPVSNLSNECYARYVKLIAEGWKPHGL